MGDVPDSGFDYAAAAADPNTDPETLRQIAYHYPQLRATVAVNPSAYEGLLEWLGQLGDPAVNAALRRRRSMGAEPQTATTPVTPAVGVPRAPEGGTRRSRGLKIALICLVALAIVLVIPAAYLVWGGGNSEPTAEPAASTTTSEGSTAEPSPSETESQEVRYPAPAEAVTASAIVAPSGNIVCELSQDAVTCNVAERNYSGSGLGDCDAGAFSITADTESAALSCDTQLDFATGAVLDYGTSAVNGYSVCYSYESGMSCWNTVSGRSFAISRQGWMQGTDGQIEDSEFRW